jgi:hypothetical protein
VPLAASQQGVPATADGNEVKQEPAASLMLPSELPGAATCDVLHCCHDCMWVRTMGSLDIKTGVLLDRQNTARHSAPEPGGPCKPWLLTAVHRHEAWALLSGTTPAGVRQTVLSRVARQQVGIVSNIAVELPSRSAHLLETVSKCGRQCRLFCTRKVVTASDIPHQQQPISYLRVKCAWRRRILVSINDINVACKAAEKGKESCTFSPREISP